MCIDENVVSALIDLTSGLDRQGWSVSTSANQACGKEVNARDWLASRTPPAKAIIPLHHTNPRDQGELQVTRSLSLILLFAANSYLSFILLFNLHRGTYSPYHIEQMISHGFSVRTSNSNNGRHLRRAQPGHRRRRERVLSTKDPSTNDWVS